MYIGPVLFKKILNNQIYLHYCLLHAAFKILCSSQFIHIFINEARIYLQKFFDIMSLLYGDTSMTINTHNLIHIVEDVEVFKCSLDNISVFPYENMLGKIRKLILTQACRRIHDINYINKSISVTQIAILKQQICKNYIRIFKLNYKKFILSTKTSDNYVNY